MYKREKTTGKEIITFDGYWELQAVKQDKPLDKKRYSIWQLINRTRLRCIHEYRGDVRQTHQNARLERPCDKLASRLGVGKGSCNSLSSFRVASGAGVFT